MNNVADLQLFPPEGESDAHKNIIIASNNEDTPDFPVDCFPKEYIDILTTLNKKNKPLDIINLYYLSVLSSAIGNSISLSSYNDTWSCKANIFGLSIDFSGGNKTGTQKNAESPIKAIEMRLAEEFESRRISYDKKWLNYVVANKSKETGEKLNKADLKTAFELEGNYEPRPERFKISQTTTEALIKKLGDSERGILWSRDEFRGLLSELGAYKGGLGSDFETLLELHSGGDIVVDRVTSGTTTITDPFVTLIGGMQPDLIPVMYQENFAQQGFPQRFMMVFPKMTEESSYSLDDLIPKAVTAECAKKWGKFITGVYFNNVFKDNTSKELICSRSGKQIMVDWFNGYKVEMLNASANSVIRSFSSKLDYYLYKCIMLVHVLEECFESENYEIPVNVSDDTIKKGAKLAEYFADMWFKVYRVNMSLNTKTELRGKRKDLYAVLPANFMAKEAVKLAEEHNIMSRKSVYRFLSDKSGVFFSQDKTTKQYSKTKAIDHEE